MARRCDLTDKKHQTGNNVSHAQNKSKRQFKVNLQNVTLRSETLGRNLSLRIATSTLRTIDFYGGLDAFLLNTSATKLSQEGAQLKRDIKKLQAAA